MVTLLLLLCLCLCLTATAASAQQLLLSWQDRSFDEQGFIVEKRRTGAAVFVEAARLPANTVRWIDKAVSPGVSYTYQVRAYNAAGVSGPTNEAHGMPQGVSTPPHR